MAVLAGRGAVGVRDEGALQLWWSASRGSNAIRPCAERLELVEVGLHLRSASAAFPRRQPSSSSSSALTCLHGCCVFVKLSCILGADDIFFPSTVGADLKIDRYLSTL